MILDYIKKIDYVILLSILPIIIFGLLSIYPLSDENLAIDYFFKQSIFIVLGLSFFIILSFLDYRFLRNSYLVFSFYIFSVSLLILVLIFGTEINGSRAWFNFGFISFQPADLMKLSLIILLSKYFSKRHIEIAYFKHILISFCYMFLPFVLIMKQPDLGSAVVIFFIWLGMIFTFGLSKKHLLILFGLGFVSLFFLWNFYFKTYQKLRIISFINPNYDIRGSGWNVYQATIAAGSGGLLGKGFGYGTQGRFNFLPAHESDFIFATFLEEWGFVGGIIIFILILILIFHLSRYSLKAESNFESLFILGICIYFILHFVINIGMNIGLLPVTGIPLPFMSYGGSHILIECISLGICGGMSRYSKVAHLSRLKNEFLGLE